MTFKHDATTLARRRASAEARPPSEANGVPAESAKPISEVVVGPQRRSPEGT